MKARFVRVAALAVLSALFFGLHASAAPGQPARLEPTRVFDPSSESLLGPLDARIHGMSLLARSIFNLNAPEALVQRDMAEMLAFVDVAPVTSVYLPGVAQVQFEAPQLQPSAVPLQQLSTAAGPAITVPARAELSNASAPDVPAPSFAPVHFGSYASYSPAVQSLAANVSVPVRVGNVRFNGVMGGLQEQSLQADAFRAMQVCGTTDENAACPYLRDANAQSLVAGTDFNLRAGQRDVNLQLSSSVAHLSSGDSAIFPYIPVDPDAQLNENFDVAGPDTSVVQYPGLADVVKHGVDARLAVPVTNRITLGLQYNRSHYQGDYGNSLLPGLDAYKDTYSGNVSYQLPNTSSLLTLSARQYRYQDTFSSFNLTQTRADLNFTVKF